MERRSVGRGGRISEPQRLAWWSRRPARPGLIVGAGVMASLAMAIITPNNVRAQDSQDSSASEEAAAFNASKACAQTTAAAQKACTAQSKADYALAVGTCANDTDDDHTENMPLPGQGRPRLGEGRLQGSARGAPGGVREGRPGPLRSEDRPVAVHDLDHQPLLTFPGWPHMGLQYHKQR